MVVSIALDGRCGQRPCCQSQSGWGILPQTLQRASFTALIFLLPVPVPMPLLPQKLAISYIHLLTMILTHKDHVCKHYLSNHHCRDCVFRPNRCEWPGGPCQDWVSEIPSAGYDMRNVRDVSGTMTLFQQHPGLGQVACPYAILFLPFGSAHSGFIHGQDQSLLCFCTCMAELQVSSCGRSAPSDTMSMSLGSIFLMVLRCSVSPSSMSRPRVQRP